jgi:hypothetical protein
MSLDLMSVEAIGRYGEVTESKAAYFIAQLPEKGSHWYFHTIFKPLPVSAIEEIPFAKQLTNEWGRFLSIQNGASLFLGALHLYGLTKPGQLLYRGLDLDLFQPFGIEGQNSDFRWLHKDRFILIGGYGYDGSRICQERDTGGIVVFDRGGSIKKAVSSSPFIWLEEEIARLSLLFDHQGNCLVSEHETVPHNASIQ